MKLFEKQRESFTDGHVLNPTEQAALIWAGRDGHYIIQNHNLRRIIVGLLIAQVMTTGGLVYQSLKSTVEPYVLEVDHTTGAVKNVGMVATEKYQPQEASVKYFLRQFIMDTREVELDPISYKKRRVRAYSFCTENSLAKLNAEIQSENKNADFGKKTVQVNIDSILPIEGGSSYTVRWTEEEFFIGSGQKKTVAMSGVFTVALVQPKDAETIKTNPLGIYFSDFNWSKDSTEANKK